MKSILNKLAHLLPSTLTSLRYPLSVSRTASLDATWMRSWSPCFSLNGWFHLILLSVFKFLPRCHNWQDSILLQLNNTPLFKCTRIFNLFIRWLTLCCLHFLAVVKHAAINMAGPLCLVSTEVLLSLAI